MAFGHLSHGKSPLEVPVVTGPDSTIVEFTAGGVIVAGDVLALDLTQTGAAQAEVVIQATVANAAAIGVALEAITAAEATAGASVRVCIAGYVEGVNATGGAGLAQGNPVIMSAATAGCVDINTAASITPVLGVALDAEAANAVTLYLFRQL